MNSNLIKMSIGALMLTGATTAAHADIDPNSISTQTVTLNIVSEQVVSNMLTPVSSSINNDVVSNETLANGSVSVPDGSAQIFAIRWTPGSGDINPGAANHIVLHGTSDPANTLNVQTGANSGVLDPATGWTVDALQESSMTYKVYADGAQTVPVDRYVIKIDAGIWNS